ncbi:GNAT family N-acetyltransferase [Microvirga tunisiensis]|uniref:GNAT family N-acetyltransferase n=1 Tax=Pannonibacter tanglangensis TaxID=2750084 RepID=A0A7X5F6X3_9HYPH|nr:GNAT family N-acetyltransferase [Pannonibacter sp. XCT-53]NBN79930.1 GNAT family N-acetyltransferase [Pannonibacter sp. XCT-53]
MSPQPSPSGSSPLLSSLSIRPVSPGDLEILSRLTTQNLRGRLASPQPGDGACHLAAWLGEVPAGLLVSRRDPDRPRTQELLSLMVTPLLRRQGLARLLLRDLGERMLAEGRSELTTSWSDRLPQLDSFVGLLAGEGWSVPQPARLRMSFNVGERHDALALAAGHVARARAAGLESIRLDAAEGDLGAAVQSAARIFARAGVLPAWADPTPWLDRCDRRVTQVLRDQTGAICGWLLAEHQPAFNRWLAPIGWCSTGPAHMFLGMSAWLAALEAEAGPGATLILQPTQGNGRRVCRLLDRHFRPFALWADTLVVSRRQLVPAGH